MAPLLVFRKLTYGTCIVLSLVTLGISATWESKLVGNEAILFFIPTCLAASCVTSVGYPVFLLFGKLEPRLNWVVYIENAVSFPIFIVWTFTGAEALMIAFPFGGGGCLSLYANYGVDYPPDSTDYCGQFAALGIVSIIIGGLLLFLQIAIVNYSRRLRLMALREPTVIHCHYINPPPAATPLGVPVSAPPYGPLAGGFSPQLLHQQQGTRTPLDSSHAYPPSSPYGPLPPQPNFRAVPSAKEGGHVVQLPSQPDFNQTYPRGGDMELLARA